MIEKEANKNKAKKYTIEELSNLTGFSRRTIRFYVQKNIIEPPSGRGKGGFYYDSHLSNLLKIEDPEKYVRDLRVRYEIVPGLEINISRDLEEKKNKKILETIRLIKTIF